MKKRLIIALSIIIAGFSVTPIFVQLAYAERGYEAIGGEYGPLVLSFLIAAFVLQGFGKSDTENNREGSEDNVVEVSAVREEVEGSGFDSSWIREGLCGETEATQITAAATTEKK